MDMQYVSEKGSMHGGWRSMALWGSHREVNMKKT